VEKIELTAINSRRTNLYYMWGILLMGHLHKSMMNANDFINSFEGITFPNLGFIKIPQIPISDEEKKAVKLPPEATQEQVLYALAQRGFNDKLKSGVIPKDQKKVYAERLRMEFDVIKSLFFIDYIILVYKIIEFCKKNDILNSPSRGSCGGSLLLYVLGVIKIDPIKHKLLFERFISAARTEIREINGEKYLASSSLPDVDIDSDRALKSRINDFMAESFPKRTAAILTFNTFQSKSLLKEVLKCVENVDEDTAKAASSIIETKFSVVDTIEETMEKNPAFAKWSKDHALSCDICNKLKGLIRNKSVHPSGVLICYDELLSCVPTELSSDKKEVTSYDMEYAQAVGIKVDNLGLKNLGSIKMCLDMVGKKMEDIDVSDPSIYSFLLLHADYTYGIFQAEDGLGKQVLKQIRPMNVEDVTNSIAIGRPGSLSFLDAYLKFRKTGERREIDPRVEDILAPTGNIIIFQETIMALAGRMADFSPQERDGIRKAVGKKLMDKMMSYKEKFVAKSLQNGYKEEFVDSIWKTFEESGNYSFNRCIFEEELVEKETYDGYVYTKIKNIIPGDRVKAFDTATKKTHNVNVIHIFRSRKTIYEVTLGDHRQIRTSIDHKFLCEDMVMRPLRALTSLKTKVIISGGKPVEIKSIELFRAMAPTVDLEVDSLDHNFYANGIVVSNSHSIGYATLTCITAYLKANHILEYFLCLLKMVRHEPDPIAEIATIHRELKHFGIKLLPPNLVKSQMDFSIEGKDIRFGLSSIKGISEKTIQKMDDFKRQHANKFELFESAKEVGLNIGALSSLIQAGTLDNFGENRSLLVYEAQLWNTLSSKEKIYALTHAAKVGDFKLAPIVLAMNKQLKDEKSRPIIKDSRFATIQRGTDKYKAIYNQNKVCQSFANWFYETSLCGYATSTTLIEIFREKRRSLIPLTDVIETPDGNKCEFIGVVQEDPKTGVSKAKGSRYAKYMIADEFGAIKVMIFNDSLEQCKSLNGGRLPKEGDIVIVAGVRKGDDCIFANLMASQQNQIYTKLSDLKDSSEPTKTAEVSTATAELVTQVPV
jgi:DNA polymerase III alpha subunit